jgi:hypothetical protein
LIAETSITPQEYLVADQHDTVSPDSFRAFFTPSGFFYSDSVIRTQVLSFTTPSLAVTALVGGVPMALAAAAILVFGVETRNRALEQITGETFASGRIGAD